MYQVCGQALEEFLETYFTHWHLAYRLDETGSQIHATYNLN
jgi:hypothetical protein